MPANTTEIEKRLWDAADDLRANSKLKSAEYSMPVLGLIFLRYADYKFEQAEETLRVETLHATSLRGRRRAIGKADYQARGVLYLREEAQGWSLNPRRYVGVVEREADDFDFDEKLGELNEELETLNAEARELEERIGEHVATLLNGMD